MSVSDYSHASHGIVHFGGLSMPLGAMKVGEHVDIELKARQPAVLKFVPVKGDPTVVALPRGLKGRIRVSVRADGATVRGKHGLYIRTRLPNKIKEIIVAPGSFDRGPVKSCAHNINPPSRCLRCNPPEGASGS